MNPRDKAALVFIESYIETHGYAPSFADIMDAVGEKSKGTVHNRIKRLVKSGHLAMAPGVSRSIRVVNSAH